jgi:dihydrodipicolinate synthase/N-acetylneuraminate lyase
MIRSMLRNAIETRAEQLLHAAGLERRRSMIDYMVTATGCFFAGAIVGGCVALLLAPTSGEELRASLSERMRAASERARKVARSRADRVARAYDDGTSNAAS